jgi:hypothetical protein
MPKALHDKLKREAAKHPEWSEERKDRYVYGTLQKHEDKKKGKK